MKLPFFNRKKIQVTMQDIEQEHFNQALRLKNWHDKEQRIQNITIMVRWCDWMNKKYITTQEQVEYIVKKKTEYLTLLDLQNTASNIPNMRSNPSFVG